MEVTKRQWQGILALKLATGNSGGYASIKDVNRFLDYKGSTATCLENLVHNEDLVESQSATNFDNRRMNRYRLTKSGKNYLAARMKEIVNLWELKKYAHEVLPDVPQTANA